MKTIFLILLTVCSYEATAQIQETWSKRYDSLGNTRDEAASIAVDNSGNVYVTGVSYTSFVTSNFATVKYNSNGIQIWTAIYNGPAVTDSSVDFPSAIAVDTDGNVYVTGSSFGAGGTRFDLATVKYNSSGTEVWVSRYNGSSNYNDYSSDIAVDDSGNVYVTGSSHGSGFNQDYTTIKYNTSGVQQWISFYNGTASTSDYANSIVIDNAHSVYITGASSGIGTGNDMATIKYNSAGVQLWASRYIGVSINQDVGKEIAVDGGGNVYITGESWGNGTNTDYATVKYNSSGIQMWAPRYNGTGNSTDISYAIAVDNSGNVFVTGQSAGIGTSYDYLTLKYSSGGVQQWAERYDFGPGGNRDDRAFDLAIDNSSNVYVTGWSSSSTFNDYATIKYNSNGIQQWLRRYNGTGSNDDAASSIALDNSGNVYVTGRSYNSLINYDFTTIRYTPEKTLQLTALIQGFYDPFFNSMVSDTATVVLRNVTPPFAIVESTKGILNSSGSGTFSFFAVSNGSPNFILVRHRNTIETWSAGGNSFTTNSLTYNFTVSAFQAFGSNMILEGNKYCLYNGDVNQEGVVDATDVITTYNDASNFVTGYVNTDVNGDNNVDVSDVILVYNNSINFVGVIRP